MLERVRNHIESNFPYLKNSRCLIACSGGLDSVVLTHICHELEFDIALAHCNFNLRAEESDDDEAFVMDLADRLDLEVFIESFDTNSYAEEHKLSIQVAARELRYMWFYELVEAFQFDLILTAHHADDNLETILINLTRGTGIAGLIGIPEVNDQVLRPLLPFTRQELEHYAEAHKLTWREDSSNASDKYARNHIRHHVIPKLKELNQELLQNVNATIENLKDTADIVDESLNAVAKRAISEMDDNAIRFKISEFKKVNNPKAYLFEMFKDYGFKAWDDIVDLLDAQSGKQVFSESYRLIKDRKHLILTDIDNVEQSAVEIQRLDNDIDTPLGRLSFTKTNTIDTTDSATIYVDMAKLVLPLMLRSWKKGDVFYPIGLNGKKKLSKFFKDEKMSLIQKEEALILCSNEKIVWVVGRRADDRFKTTSETDQILKITIN